MSRGCAALAATLGASVLITWAPADAAPASAPASSVLQTAAAKTRVGGWSTKGVVVRAGGELGATVRVTPKAQRKISVEYRRAGTTKWLSQSRTTTSPSGTAYVRFQPPRDGKYEVRLVVAAMRSAGEAVSGTRVVTVKGTAALTKLSKWTKPPRPIVGESFVMTGLIKPPAVRRIEIQSRPPGATAGWTPLAVTNTTKAGEFRTTATLNRAGEWRLRLVVAGSPTMQPLSAVHLVRPMPRLKFNIAHAAGLALAPAGSAFMNTSSARSAVPTAQMSATDPTLVAVNADGSLTNAVASGQANVARFLIAPNDDVYMLFSRPSEIETGGYGRCLLARVDRATGKPSCVDSTLSSITWWAAHGTTLNPAIQFDDSGAVYYLGYIAGDGTNPGRAVLRKDTNGVRVDLINDAISVGDFLVAGDGSVFLKGSTTVTGTSWFRRITPQGGLQTISGGNGNLLHKFPDGNIYFGQSVDGTFGVRRYLTDTGEMDPTFWIAAGNGTPTTHRDISPFCTGPDAATNQAFCGSAGTSVGKLVTTPNGTVYGVAGRVMQYFPTLAKPSINVASITAMSAANDSDLVIAGLRNGVNVLTSYDAETDAETELLGAANETEIYRLHHVPAAGTVMFDGLRFADNTYVVGQINLDSLEVTAAPTGSSRLVDFQTF